MVSSTMPSHQIEDKALEEELLPTKVCPQCGQELFADMDICYGCLYDFSRSEGQGIPMLPDPLQEEDGETLDSTASLAPPFAAKDRSYALTDSVSRGACDGPYLFIQTGDVDLTLPLLKEGIEVGRDPTNDVVLHSRAVSRRHVRIVPTDEGVLAKDQGATNPAILRGREVRGECRMEIGETLNICGALLTLVGVQST